MPQTLASKRNASHCSQTTTFLFHLTTEFYMTLHTFSDYKFRFEANLLNIFVTKYYVFPSFHPN